MVCREQLAEMDLWPRNPGALELVGMSRETGCERVLRKLFSAALVPEHPEDEAVDRPLVPQHDLAKCRLSSIERSTNQFDVGGWHSLSFSTGTAFVWLQKLL